MIRPLVPSLAEFKAGYLAQFGDDAGMHDVEGPERIVAELCADVEKLKYTEPKFSLLLGQVRTFLSLACSELPPAQLPKPMAAFAVQALGNGDGAGDRRDYLKECQQAEPVSLEYSDDPRRVLEALMMPDWPLSCLMYGCAASVAVLFARQGHMSNQC